MRDIDVRQALRAQTLVKFYADPHSRVVEEMGLCEGSSRIDIAVVNGSLHGFEIKSESDTLIRLAQQAKAYGQVFDHMTIVLGSNHLKAAVRRVPKWWAIAVAEPKDAGLKIVSYRKGTRNKKPSAYHIAQLLWRDEALTILSELKLDKGLKSKPRTEIWSALACALPIRKLQARVRDTLKLRAAWRSPLR